MIDGLAENLKMTMTFVVMLQIYVSLKTYSLLKSVMLLKNLNLD